MSRSCDITLNAWALWLLNSTATAAGSPAWGPEHAVWSRWRDALVRQLLVDAGQARARGQQGSPAAANAGGGGGPGPGGYFVYSDYDTLVWVRLALGAAWSPPMCGKGEGAPPGGICASLDMAADLSLDRLVGGGGARASCLMLHVSCVLHHALMRHASCITSCFMLRGPPRLPPPACLLLPFYDCTCPPMTAPAHP